MSDHPHELDDGAASDRPVFDLAYALDAVPVHVTVSPDVNLDSEDPALVEETGRRRCVAVKAAGGRCSSAPVHSLITCSIHGGLVDPSEGGRAVARIRREAQQSEEERGRLARLSSRDVIREALAERHTQLRATVHTLLDAAAAGDLQAAKLVGPYLNQAHGLPTERVEVTTPSSGADLDGMSTADLEKLVREQRASLRAVDDQAA